MSHIAPVQKEKPVNGIRREKTLTDLHKEFHLEVN